MLDLAARSHFTPDLRSSSSYNPRWGSGAQWVMANRPNPRPLAIFKILPDGRESVVSATGDEVCILDDVSEDRHFLLSPAVPGNLWPYP